MTEIDRSTLKKVEVIVNPHTCPTQACAHTNVAADNLLEALLALNVSAIRVGHPAATRESLRHATLDAAVNRLKTPEDDLSKRGARERLQQEALGAADVVVASCVGAGSDVLAPAPGRRDLNFGTVLVDEAAQATEPACLVPVAAAKHATQLILVGDPRQLPPTVLSRAAQRDGLGTSLFQRLARLGERRRVGRLGRLRRGAPGAVRTSGRVPARRRR